MKPLIQPLCSVPEQFFRDLVNGGNWYRQAWQQRKSSGRWSPSDAHGLVLWIVQANTPRNLLRRPDRSGSCSGSGAASFVFFGPGHQQPRHSSRIWGCPGVAPGKGLYGFGSRYVAIFGNSFHGYKYFDADAFFQDKMDTGNGGFLLVAWCLTLPPRPESCPVLFTFSPPDRVLHWQ